ncbi:DUF2970 domain-containing protein [Alcaligenes faecalis]|jgi:hypothetical protein|uniref:DUF2970 domain-containing protein n=4 Tax=Alcaligenes TaxID=507 RepID=A0A0A2NJ66_ALCFA|nr:MULTISPECIES: DUF2970 domain-containing protein [Alcaligenes]EJC61174.1 hypothetical protein QWA_15839 [Alcaligenes faecalis subsp. faecalis NCIB 8687]MDH4866289.1 DUF2970 domain-containing protein [Bacillus cereus]ALO38867.1 hypothetical protein UZ73_11730 [Alcaligenes faecalis]ARP55407.1 hypothetical protein ALFP_3520 [Alcaligenes faecalis]ASC90732.1 hypothetical protein CDA61_11180 [Alcaligenes faecalis]
MDDDFRDLTRRKLSFFQTLKAIAWGFFGVRRGRDHEQDIAKINPVYLIIAALIATVVFVVGLIMVARWFIGQAS